VSYKVAYVSPSGKHDYIFSVQRVWFLKFPVMLILGLGLGLRDLALAKKLRPKILWDYKSHLGFNCRRILFSDTSCQLK